MKRAWLVTDEDLAAMQAEAARKGHEMVRAKVAALDTERDLLLGLVERLCADNDRLRAEARGARAELRAVLVNGLVEVIS